MKVVIAAGGTGGHFYPGLAVARELQNANIAVTFLIKKGDYVRPLLDREGFPYVAISAGGFNRRFDLKIILTIGKLIVGFFEAFQFLRAHRPNVLLVMGGYLSVPPALAAKLLGIPIVLHEQNVLPGLANRFLGCFASRVAVSFSSSVSKFGKKASTTGNPVRKEFSHLPSAVEAREKWSLDADKTTVFIFGGSLGAHRLNELVVQAFEGLQAFANHVQVLHITGPSDVTWVREKYEKMPFTFYVDSYCHDMPAAYAAADFVIGRSGASTVSELIVVKKPALFVPYPLATAGHQTENAQILSRLGAARVYEQRDLEKGELREILRELFSNPASWQEWTDQYRQVDIDPAAAAGKIVRLIREITV